MDKAITGFLTKEIKWKQFSFAPLDLLLLLGTTVVAILLRESIFNYTALNTVNESQELISIELKVFYSLIDFVLAVICACLVLSLTNNKIKSFLAYGITLMFPVLTAGSAMWGMGDSIYLLFTVAAVGFALRKKADLGLISLGIASIFNMNALFVLPVFIMLYLRKEVKIISFIFPFIGFWTNKWLSMPECPIFNSIFAAERLLSESRPTKLLSYNYPNIFQFFGPGEFVQEYSQASVWLVVFAAVIFGVLTAMNKKENTNKRILSLFVLSALLIPFLAPFMNERSGMLAAVLALILGFTTMKKFYIPIVQGILVYIAFSAFFRGESVIPLALAAGVSLLLIMDLLREEI